MENAVKFKYFGAMLDCSRNAVMTVEQVKKFMSLLKKMGYNCLGLYLEDTYEVEGEPYFGHFRGRYSKAELKEIDDFGYSIGIEVVPYIQTLAHFNQLLKWPQYAAFSEGDGFTLLVDDERTYKLIDKLFATMRECFRTKRITVGMDEAVNVGNRRYRDIHGEVDRVDVLLRHMNKVAEMAEKYDFEPTCWPGMLRKMVTGAYTIDSTIDYKTDKRILEQFPKNMAVQTGDYNQHRKENSEEILTSKIKLNKDFFHKDNVSFLGGCWKWASFAPRNELAIINSYYCIKCALECGVEEYYTSLWGDDGAESSIYSVLPALVANACFARGITDPEALKQKFNEWTGENFDDYMLVDKPDYTPDYMIGFAINLSKYAFYNDCFLGKCDSMIAPYDAANYAEYAKQLFAAADRAGEYKYIYDFYANLSNVLALKADIGIRTRKWYDSGRDAETLDLLIKDYKEISVRLEAFYEAFHTVWYKENKPQGFEVQDIRVGGLMRRVKNCTRTLEDYRDKKLDKILELEEKTLPAFDPMPGLPYSGVEVEGSVQRRYMLDWQEMVTTNII